MQTNKVVTPFTQLSNPVTTGESNAASVNRKTKMRRKFAPFYNPYIMRFNLLNVLLLLSYLYSIISVIMQDIILL